MSEEDARKIIDTIKQEEFPYALAIAKAYEKLEEENKNLKEKLEENTKIYLHTSKYASKMEEKYVELNYILTEFEKWLEEEIKKLKQSQQELLNLNISKNSKIIHIKEFNLRISTNSICLDKLQELKGIVSGKI